MYLMFTPTDLFSMRIVLVIFLFLTVVGILIATAMLIYECYHKTKKCNKKKGLVYVCVCKYISNVVLIDRQQSVNEEGYER